MGLAKDFCKQGHDTRITGRSREHQCYECMRVRKRALHAQNEPQPEIEDKLDLESQLLRAGVGLRNRECSVEDLTALKEWFRAFAGEPS